jgi:hypothetical protein
VIIARDFKASLFKRQFGSILIREVIEHVEQWCLLLREASAALLPGGLLQVQTPRPTFDDDPIPYQDYHLQLFSTAMLPLELWRCGLTVIDGLFWHCGHAYLCRKSPA